MSLAGKVVAKRGVHGEKTHRTFMNCFVAHAKPDAKIEGTVTLEWGGKEGTQVTYGLNGSIQDDKSHASFRAEIDNEGRGRATATGGVSTDSSDDKGSRGK